MVPRPFTPARSMRSRSCADVIQRCQGCLWSVTREVTGREPGDDVDCSPVVCIWKKKHKRLYLRQIVEVKKLTKFFSQFSLGNYSIRQEFQALLLDLGKERTHELIQKYRVTITNGRQKKVLWRNEKVLVADGWREYHLWPVLLAAEAWGEWCTCLARPDKRFAREVQTTEL